MMDAEEGLVMKHGQGFASRYPTISAPTSPGAQVAAMPSIAPQVQPSLFQRRCRDGPHVFHMGAGGHLGHHPPIATVNVNLGGDDIAEHGAIAHHRRRRFITTGFQGKTVAI
jgi:hypothetical protein